MAPSAFGRAASARNPLVIAGRGIGEVVSRSGLFAPGDLVLGDVGWRQLATVEAKALRQLSAGPHPLSWHLGVLGAPGLTALIALEQIAGPKPGETIFISSSAGGTVGSAAGQIAKSMGCRTIGSASAGKLDAIRESYGFRNGSRPGRCGGPFGPIAIGRA